MPTEVLYRQCTLRQSNVEQTAWIPSEFARPGRLISVKDENDVWSDTWTVSEVFGRMTAHDADLQRSGQKKFERVLGRE